MTIRNDVRRASANMRGKLALATSSAWVRRKIPDSFFSEGPCAGYVGYDRRARTRNVRGELDGYLDEAAEPRLDPGSACLRDSQED